MITKSSAIDRLLRERPHLRERRVGLPDIGTRIDGQQFNPTVQAIANAIDFYGYEVRDENIATIPDTDLGSGNPVMYPPFPPAIQAMKRSLNSSLIISSLPISILFFNSIIFSYTLHKIQFQNDDR